MYVGHKKPWQTDRDKREKEANKEKVKIIKVRQSVTEEGKGQRQTPDMKWGKTHEEGSFKTGNHKQETRDKIGGDNTKVCHELRNLTQEVNTNK